MRKATKAAMNKSRRRAAKKAQEDYTVTDKEVRKASEKINETTMTTWPNKLKKLQDKET